MKNIAWRVITRLRSWQQFLLDERRYRRWSVPTQDDALGWLEGRQLECQITKDYHRIEKGLTFAQPKRPFGADARARLKLAMGAGVWNEDERYRSYAVDALTALDRWNDLGEIDDAVAVPANSLRKAHLSRQQIHDFFQSRRSVRAFDPNRVPEAAVIVEAAALAVNTPSVCNRQSWRAHYYEGSGAQKILAHQAGNRGFGETIPAVLVISTDARLFSGSGERNQRWVDGGLFAMTLVWALHAVGLSSCMLNWSRSNKDSSALRADADIPEWEDIIVLIAVGYPVPEHRVARSARRPVEEVLCLHVSADDRETS